MKLLLMLFPLMSYGALTDVDFLKFEVQDEVHSNLKHEITVSEFRNEKHMEELLQHYSNLISHENPGSVISIKSFYSEKTLEKYNLPKNEAEETLDRLWPKYFENLEQERFELGENSLKDVFLDREPSSVKKRIQSVRNSLQNKFRKNFVGSFAVVRGFAASGASFFAFIQSGLPPLPALVTSGMIGLMSGGIQFKINEFSRLMDTNYYSGSVKNWFLSKMPFLKKFGVKEVTNLGEKSSIFKLYLKMLMFEFAFVGVIESTLVGMESFGWIKYHFELFETVTSGLISVAAQGTWEAGVMKDFNPRIEKVERLIKAAELENNVLRLKHLKNVRHKLLMKRAGMFVYGSVAAISGLVFKTMGLEVYKLVFGGLAAAGGVNLIRVNLRSKKDWVHKQFMKIPGMCKRYIK